MAEKDKAPLRPQAAEKARKAEARDQRLSESLRANLEKRKSQARQRAGKPIAKK